MVIRIVADFLSFGKWAGRICCGELGAVCAHSDLARAGVEARPYAIIVYRVRLFASLRMINA